MTREGSVTQWIRDYKEKGEQYAATAIWQRYCRRVHGLADLKLGQARRTVADEEDVGVIAFTNFCRGLREGRFAEVDNRDDLWQVLAMLTVRRALDHVRKVQRRGEVGESVLMAPDESQVAGVADVEADQALTPAAMAEAMEEINRRLNDLPDDETRQIVCLRLEGYSVPEIADLIGCAVRTVERRLQKVRELWQQDIGPEHA